MNMTLKDLIGSAVETIRAPKQGARQVMALNIPRRQRWEMLLLIVVISIILAEITLMLGGDSEGAVFGGPALSSPIVLGAVQLFFLVVMVNAIFLIGRRAGGHGSLDDAILLVTWLQFILICIQVAQTVIFLVVPAFAAMIGLASVVLFFWLLTNFVAEMHGFNSLGGVFTAILATLIGFAVVMSVILTVFGFQITG